MTNTSDGTTGGTGSVSNVLFYQSMYGGIYLFDEASGQSTLIRSSSTYYTDIAKSNSGENFVILSGSNLYVYEGDATYLGSFYVGSGATGIDFVKGSEDVIVSYGSDIKMYDLTGTLLFDPFYNYYSFYYEGEASAAFYNGQYITAHVERSSLSTTANSRLIVRSGTSTKTYSSSYLITGTSVSHNGDKVAFVVKNSSHSLTSSQLYVMDVATGYVTKLTTYSSYYYYLTDPEFSPDGEYIAFAYKYYTSENEIKKVSVTGGTPTTMGITTSYPATPSW